MEGIPIMRRMRPPWLASSVCCLGLLAAPAGFAQGEATTGERGTSGSTVPSIQPGTSPLGGGSTRAPGRGRGLGGPGASPGPVGPGRGSQIESRLRDAGAARPPQQDEQQLRELNALSRQLTPPGTPVPAPQAEGGPTGR
jgi:hypothetical protein